MENHGSFSHQNNSSQVCGQIKVTRGHGRTNTVIPNVFFQDMEQFSPITPIARMILTEESFEECMIEVHLLPAKVR
jgi:hypothetical protein